MTFMDKVLELEKLNMEEYWAQVSPHMIEKSIYKETLTTNDFLNLLSPLAGNFLEEIAQRAHQLTLQHFGRVIFLYTPMYISNHCVNRCLYCGFNVDNPLTRKTLTLEEIEKEAKIIASTGLRHILILTGESKHHANTDYLVSCISLLKKYFSSISIEIYPMDTSDYKKLVEAGVDGITIYQETYNREVYDRVHPRGPKKDYQYRLEAPERAGDGQIRSINIGALLGLGEWRQDAFFTGIHASYLQDKYPGAEISVSLPRLRPHLGSFQPAAMADDKDLVQTILAYRLFMPRLGITLSTRENSHFRDNLIRLGVTKMSAGVTTEVGGHSQQQGGTGQFEISDGRSVEEIRRAILDKGYQPVFHDWMAI